MNALRATGPSSASVPTRPPVSVSIPSRPPTPSPAPVGADRPARRPVVTRVESVGTDSGVDLVTATDGGSPGFESGSIVDTRDDHRSGIAATIPTATIRDLVRTRETERRVRGRQ